MNCAEKSRMWEPVPGFDPVLATTVSLESPVFASPSLDLEPI